jgi:hypothetical protein
VALELDTVKFEYFWEQEKKDLCAFLYGGKAAAQKVQSHVSWSFSGGAKLPGSGSQNGIPETF